VWGTWVCNGPGRGDWYSLVCMCACACVRARVRGGWCFGVREEKTNTRWRYFKTGFRGKYLDLKRTRTAA
jgi:hypothetical protein